VNEDKDAQHGIGPDAATEVRDPLALAAVAASSEAWSTETDLADDVEVAAPARRWSAVTVTLIAILVAALAVCGVLAWIWLRRPAPAHPAPAAAPASSTPAAARARPAGPKPFVMRSRSEGAFLDGLLADGGFPWDNTNEDGALVTAHGVCAEQEKTPSFRLHTGDDGADSEAFNRDIQANADALYRDGTSNYGWTPDLTLRFVKLAVHTLCPQGNPQ
jgi:hypothetical protein